MSMKSFVLRASLAALLVASPFVAHAQFGGLKSPIGGGGKSSGNVGADVEKFMSAATDSRNLTSKALEQLVGAIGLASASTELSEKAKAAGEIKDPKERGAALDKVEADRLVELKKALASKEAQDKVSAMDTEKKKKIAKSFFNYALGVLRAKDVIPQGQNVVKSVASSPMDIGKVAPVKDALPQLEKTVSNSVDLMNGVPTFFKQTGVSFTMPADASAKPATDSTDA